MRPRGARGLIHAMASPAIERTRPDEKYSDGGFIGGYHAHPDPRRLGSCLVKVGVPGLCQNLLGGFAFLGTYSAQADVGLIVNLYRERDRLLGG